MLIVFWILLSIILYAYPGYALILLLLNGLKRIFMPKTRDIPPGDLPDLTLLIAAYNEKSVIQSKIDNTRELDYPRDKLSIIWITDGSTDGSPEMLKTFPEVQVLHEPERKGKTAALNRAMNHVKTPFVAFCDANTMLDKNALRYLMKAFAEKRTGCVAGEKRIAFQSMDFASGTGEGAYWRYESWIKQLESGLFSTLGAAGELYAIRTSLFEAAEPDSIIDDFIISLSIARKGYRIRYEPRACALERPSASIKDELTRKIRIASGGFQTLFRFPSLLNIFRYGFLSYEYFSHKVIRWLLVPFAIPLLFIFNFLVCHEQMWTEGFYLIFFLLQSTFYLLVALGAALSDRSTRLKFLFLPYYLIVMNYAQIAGLVRYSQKKHSVVWEKVNRA